MHGSLYLVLGWSNFLVLKREARKTSCMKFVFGLVIGLDCVLDVAYDDYKFVRNFIPERLQ